MPVTVYLKLYGVLGLDADYVTNQRFRIDKPALKVALQETLGHLVPHYVTDAEGILTVDPRSVVRTSEEMRVDLDTLAAFVTAQYDQARELELNHSLADEDDSAQVPQ